MNDLEQHTAINMALGRIFSILMRPYQPGDVQDYERARAAVLDSLENPVFVDTLPNYARDHNKGAQGD